MPKKFAGRNVQRRQRECKDCGFRFWTIELTQAELEDIELGVPERRRAQGT